MSLPLHVATEPNREAAAAAADDRRARTEPGGEAMFVMQLHSCGHWAGCPEREADPAAAHASPCPRCSDPEYAEMLRARAVRLGLRRLEGAPREIAEAEEIRWEWIDEAEELLAASEKGDPARTRRLLRAVEQACRVEDTQFWRSYPSGIAERWWEVARRLESSAPVGS